MNTRVLIVIILSIGVAAVATDKHQSPASKATVAKAVSAPPEPSGSVAKARTDKKIKVINADQAYKANCSRCHGAPHKFSDRVMSTIMRHMRVRANLTQDETQAILKYLTE